MGRTRDRDDQYCHEGGRVSLHEVPADCGNHNGDRQTVSPAPQPALIPELPISGKPMGEAYSAHRHYCAVAGARFACTGVVRSAFNTRRPARPSTVNPWELWKSLMALRDFAPIMPSTAPIS